MSIPGSTSPNLVTSHAPASLSQEGRVIAEGKKGTRLKIGDDPRFHVAVQQIEKNSSWLKRLAINLKKAFGRYVEIKRGNETPLLVNINSVATRLHLSKTEIRKAAREDHLMEFLEKRAGEVKSHFAYYDKMQQQTGTKPAVLMKAIKMGLEVLSKPPPSDKAPTQDAERKDTRHGFQIEGILFVAKKTKMGGLKLTQISESLGKGGFGEAYVASNLTKGTEKVYKLAKSFKTAIKDLVNEFMLLEEIHREGNVWGIQAKPNKLTRIILSTGEVLLGFLGKKYDGDYLSDIKKNSSVPFSDRLFEFHQLLYGLKYLEEHNIVHGDLKPGNILVKRESDGTKLVHIADLGGARDVSTLDVYTIAFEGTHTPSYFPREDEKASKQYARDATKNEQIIIQQRIDVFDMGVILYQALSKGNKPYELDSKHRPILTQIEEIKDESVPKEIKDLIRSMRDPDYTKRPSATEAFTVLDTYIKTHHPTLHEKIQQKMLNIK